jgi:hypothetical protein
MNSVKIGNTTFNADYLAENTLTTCYETFAYLRKDIVKMAWEQVNETTKKKAKKTV